MAADEPSENKTQHLHLLMAPSEVEAIDDWGFANRIRTRAEAIRRLCQIAMVFEEEIDELFDSVKNLHEAAMDILASMDTIASYSKSDPAVAEFLLKVVKSIEHVLTARGKTLFLKVAEKNLRDEGELEIAMRKSQQWKDEIESVRANSSKPSG